MRKLNNKNDKWVLIYWIDSEEISIVNFKDVSEALKTNFIKKGWIGDLPWLENGYTELYEAKILKVSGNLTYLESLVISTSGKFIKKPLSAELQKIKRSKKTIKMAKKKVMNKMAVKALQMANINEVISSDEEDEEKILEKTDNNLNGKGILKSMETHNNDITAYQEETSSASLKENKPILCENCSKCICRNWSALVTPQIVAFLSTLNESLKEKADPGQALLTKQKIMVELCPGTGIWISQSDINWALAKSNGKPKTLVMSLIFCMVTEEQLLKYKTAENFNKSRDANFQKALIHFITEKIDKILTTRDCNKAINDYIYYHKRSSSKDSKAEDEKTKECEESKSAKKTTSKKKIKSIKTQPKQTLIESNEELQPASADPQVASTSMLPKKSLDSNRAEKRKRKGEHDPKPAKKFKLKKKTKLMNDQLKQKSSRTDQEVTPIDPQSVSTSTDSPPASVDLQSDETSTDSQLTLTDPQSALTSAASQPPLTLKDSQLALTQSAATESALLSKGPQPVSTHKQSPLTSTDSQPLCRRWRRASTASKDISVTTITISTTTTNISSSISSIFTISTNISSTRINIWPTNSSISRIFLGASRI